MTFLAFREKVVMKCFVKAILVTLLLAIPSLANDSLAMVTVVKGTVLNSNKAQLQILDYLASGEKAVVSKDSELVLSYVKGGVRATVTGPCTIQVNDAGPVVLEGKKSQLVSTRPAKRVGYQLPPKFETQSGSLRRGELEIHLPRKFLPGEIEVPFTALPLYSDFYLTVYDATSKEEIYEQELEEGKKSFLIPAGKLKAGGVYDFDISASGGKNVMAERRVVVGESLAEQLQDQIEARTASSDLAAKSELLSIYLGNGLDDRALSLVDSMLEKNKNLERLQTIRENLLFMMNYHQK